MDRTIGAACGQKYSFSIVKPQELQIKISKQLIISPLNYTLKKIKLFDCVPGQHNWRYHLHIIRMTTIMTSDEFKKLLSTGLTDFTGADLRAVRIIFKP